MLGFLSVSTCLSALVSCVVDLFQSRAGFSECLDPVCTDPTAYRSRCFNPVLGFLSVSTEAIRRRYCSAVSFNPVLGFLSVSASIENNLANSETVFQSRAGFSECLDMACEVPSSSLIMFQSRAGFSECLDDFLLGRFV